MTESTVLTENPAMAEMNSTMMKSTGRSFATEVASRSASAPPQPIACNCQNARFLSAKKGRGLIGSMFMPPNLIVFSPACSDPPPDFGVCSRRFASGIACLVDCGVQNLGPDGAR